MREKTPPLLLFILLGLFLMVMLPAAGDVRCDQLVSGCRSGPPCCTQGSCRPYRTVWYGSICGCDDGDPNVELNKDVGDAHNYLVSRGYCQTYTGSGYSQYDYTKGLAPWNRCRYHAIRNPNNRMIDYKDGPEPNPQPAYFCNGNADLTISWGCVYNTIYQWHYVC